MTFSLFFLIYRFWNFLCPTSRKSLHRTDVRCHPRFRTLVCTNNVFVAEFQRKTRDYCRQIPRPCVVQDNLEHVSFVSVFLGNSKRTFVSIRVPSRAVVKIRELESYHLCVCSYSIAQLTSRLCLLFQVRRIIIIILASWLKCRYTLRSTSKLT